MIDDAGKIKIIAGLDEAEKNPDLGPLMPSEPSKGPLVIPIVPPNTGSKTPNHHDLKNDLGLLPMEQRFAENIASGMFKSHMAAAVDAGYTCNTYRHGIALWKRPKIRAAVKAIMEADEADAGFTRREYIDYLIDAAFMPVGAVDENDKLAVEISQTKFGQKVRGFSKEKAMELLGKVHGFNAPDKVEVGVDLKIGDLIGRIRQTGGRIIEKPATNIQNETQEVIGDNPEEAGHVERISSHSDHQSDQQGADVSSLPAFGPGSGAG